jgi:hypothetical protein
MAIEYGASCFVAYQTALTPEFATEVLPARLSVLLQAVATMTTRNLHIGLRDETRLKSEMRECILALEEWLDGDEGAAWQDERGFMEVAGLRGFARQLLRDMVVRAPES